MSEEKFLPVPGKFICKKCKQDVTAARFWHDSGDVTWMCTNKHISKVELVVKKKTKKDFTNE
jgi:hypothetical protein